MWEYQATLEPLSLKEFLARFLIVSLPACVAFGVWNLAVGAPFRRQLRAAVIPGLLFAVSAALGPFGLFLGLPLVMLSCGIAAAVARSPAALGIFGPIGLTAVAFALSYVISEAVYDTLDGLLATVAGLSTLMLLYMLPIAIVVLVGSGGNDTATYNR